MPARALKCIDFHYSFGTDVCSVVGEGNAAFIFVVYIVGEGYMALIVGMKVMRGVLMLLYSVVSESHVVLMFVVCWVMAMRQLSARPELIAAPEEVVTKKRLKKKCALGEFEAPDWCEEGDSGCRWCRSASNVPE